MRRSLSYSLLIVLCVFGLCVAAMGQKTTGTLEGTVKDPKGAIVPGAAITVTGVTVGFSRTVTSNDEGFYRLVDVPAGEYSITTAAMSGFSAATVKTSVAIEKTSTVDINLGIGQSVNVVQVENDPLGANIDPTDSKVQTTITSQMIEKLPTGSSFTSLLKISPATRAEPLSGGFQVDGASGSENTFLIDGVPMENFRTGTLNGVNNIPTSLVSEVQIKTGGFEAEHGGASGGVISVATKSGTDKFHGSVGSSFEPSKLQPAPRFAATKFNDNPSCANTTVLNDANRAACLTLYSTRPQSTYAIAQPKDASLNSYPDLQFSGPIMKHHVWGLAQWAPQTFETNRFSTFYNAVDYTSFVNGKLTLVPRSLASTPINPIEYHVRQTFNYGYGRIDASFWNKLRVNVSYLWNPSATKGNLPFAAITTSTVSNTTYNGISYPSGEYAKLQGGRTNADTFNVGGTYTLTSKLIVSARFSKVFLNELGTPYAIANSPRLQCQGVSSAYSQVATNCPINFQNITANSITTKDISRKKEQNYDVTYLVSSFLGRHEFKGGYQRGQTENDVQTGNAGTGTVQLLYGNDFSALSQSSLTCTLKTPLSSSTGSDCIGVGLLSRSGTNGKGKNLYQGIYFQDKWQPTNRLTLNLGVRAEKENLPSFNAGDVLAGTAIPGITQNWPRKTAPRLGAAYDLFGNGKTKIYASYGWFFDRLKFEMPRGSFGGDFFRRDYFRITADHPNYDYYSPSRILGNWTDPRGGGNPSSQGGLSILQVDLRIPSNLTTAQFNALGLLVTGVDPNLKSFRQDEITFGFEREMFSKYLFTARYSRKNIAHAMEDHAILGLFQSENYPVGNPGEGLDLQLDTATGSVKSAKPQRLYNGLEFTITRRFSGNYYWSANYTWSRLFGNYSGLASSDEGGRTSPGVDRFFDYPINGYTATGDPDNGLLATDRTHTFKAYGGYTFNWWGSKVHSTDIGFFQQILEGTPQTTFLTVVATSIPLSKRGDLGRTPTFWQTDLNFTHRYKFGSDNRYTVAFDLVLVNALNNNSVTALNTTRYRVQNSVGATDIIPTYNQATMSLIPVLNEILLGHIGPQLAALDNGTLPSLLNKPNPRNALYGQPSSYQAPRDVRFGFRFIF